MAFTDVFQKPREVSLYDIKDIYTRADTVIDNPDDIVNQVENILRHEIMNWTLDGRQEPTFRIPTVFKVTDMRDLNIDKAESSFAVELNIFSKMSTGQQAGQSETATNVRVGANILPQAQNIVVSYPKNWAGEAGGSAITKAFNLEGSEAARTIGIDSIANAFGSSRVGVDYKSANGVNINDRIKVLFTDLPFRTFDLSFSLYPKNKKQGTAFVEFIRQMKMASAPSTAEGGMLWTFPDTFKIDFVSGQRLPLFSTMECACTNITVNYTPQGVWSQHRADGTPTGMQVDLSFMELEYATKENIKEFNL